MKKICIIAFSLLLHTSIVYTGRGVVKNYSIPPIIYNGEMYNSSISIMHNEKENATTEVIPLRINSFENIRTIGLECSQAAEYLQYIKDIAKEENIALFCSPEWASLANAEDVKNAFSDVTKIIKDNLKNKNQLSYAFFNEKIKYLTDVFINKIKNTSAYDEAHAMFRNLNLE